ncbi:PREDICTED: melanoma-associated antigen B1-like [Elephantulus edwardii]|uniref:melanoma-associated antigen B1-like n=1 Tax=Elephantulus edwardii TaxID=28737 RepID=UPI0003F0833B|nr:PREDICTED: melanoma-associated antigen B1-like [Elephantulus edwardii]
MPRGQKRKLDVCEECQQLLDEMQNTRVAQAPAEEEDTFSSYSSGIGVTPESSPGSSMMFGSFSPTPPPAAEGFDNRSDEGDQSEDDDESPSLTPPTMVNVGRDPVSRRARRLVRFLIEKYKKNEPIMKADMLKAINMKYKEHFTEILKKASKRMELVFGLELKKASPSSKSYNLISKIDLTRGESLHSPEGFPRIGLLMTLLGLIFLKGNRVHEEELWECMKMLGLYPGKRHILFGEPWKFITEDFVEEGYLKYQQIPNTDPPCYEFLWGPQSRAKISKMEVLKFLAKINNTTLNSFPGLYQEALCEELEKAGACVLAMHFYFFPRANY